MAESAARHHIDDVGRILLHAQRELAQIRHGLTQGGASFGDPRAAQQALDEALSRAENNLRLKAEAVLTTNVGHSVAALPALTDFNFRSGSADGGASRSLMDVGGRVRPPRRPGSVDRRAGARVLPAATVRTEMAARATQRVLDDPHSELARRVLAEQYGVPAPKPAPGRGHAPLGSGKPPGRLVKDKMAKPTGVVEREARTNPQAPPAHIRPEDVSKGLLSLINRGLLPSTVDLTPALARAPAPAMQRPSRMHPAEDRFDKHAGPAYTSPFGFTLANLKLDLLTGVGESMQAREAREAAEEADALVATRELEATAAVVEASSGQPHARFDGGAPPSGLPGLSTAEVEQARGFEELMDTFSLHHFIIRRGELLAETPEFVSFQRKHNERWGAVSEVVRKLQDLLGEYAVPLAYVDGKLAAELAFDALALRTERELLGCLVNAEQVAAHMARPGARYAGDRAAAGKAAASRIQAHARRRQAARVFAALRRRHTAASWIRKCWLFFLDKNSSCQALAERRASEHAAWEGMTARFWREWPRIKRAKRVVVHIPSLSLAERQRRTVANLDMRQNAQLARLCDIRDPDVEVIYVSPFPLNDDTVGYFAKVLEIGGAQEPMKRVRIIVPENYHRFPAHFSLATILLYSPRALRRIEHFCRAKDAYIVPNACGPDELRLSIRLALPLFAAEPSVSAIYSTKSGSKRIFQAAHVNVPPGAHDLYDQDDLVGSLAHLIAHNLDVPKWIFKVDDEFGGRGHAHFFTADLPCFSALLVAYDADPKHWASEGVQARVQDEIATELEQLLPHRATIACRWLFRSWTEFMAAYSRSGGVIEAAPLEVRSTPSVSLLIEPDGAVTLRCTQEQMLRDYTCVGAAFPQTAVPHPALRDAALAIGRACYAKSIIGHVGVDLIAFVDDQRLLRVWAVDLNLRLTQSAAIFGLFDFLLGGEYDEQNGNYYATKRRAGAEPAGAPLLRDESDRRCYVMNELLYHPDLAYVHHSAFFNMCRLKGISFDLQAKLGTIFNLLDSFASCVIGVLSVGRTQLEALKTFADCLDFVQKEVGNATEITPEPNGYVEISIKDLIASIKLLVDRSKRHSRPAQKQPPEQPAGQRYLRPAGSEAAAAGLAALTLSSAGSAR